MHPFRIENLLRARKGCEAQSGQELVHACKKLEQLLQKERTLAQQVEALTCELAALSPERKPDYEHMYSQILTHLQNTLAQAQLSRIQQERHVHLCQERLKKATQERKVVEKIQEKHYPQGALQVKAKEINNTSN